MAAMQFADMEAMYANDENLRREDVAKLEEWQQSQPHLPAPLHSIETALFLQSCYYSIEISKQRINTYYTIRTQCPEFFANRNPFLPEMQRMLDAMVFITLPQLTLDGCLVAYTRLLDHKPETYDMNMSVKITELMLNIDLKQNGGRNGLIFVFDVEGGKLGHLSKCSILSMKKCLDYMQTAIPVRLHSIHFVNGLPFMDKVFNMIRPFLQGSYRDKLHAHFGDNSTIFKYVPQDILPIECGGTKFCATDYYKNVTRENIERVAEYIKLDECQVVDESKRPHDILYSSGLLGAEGTFKMIKID